MDYDYFVVIGLVESEEGIKNCIKDCVKALRSEKNENFVLVEELKKFVSEQNFNLNDVGTSKEELEEIKSRAYSRNSKTNAKYYLERARVDSDKDCVEFFRRRAKEEGRTIKFFGTNEEELKKLKIAGYESLVKSSAERICELEFELQRTINFMKGNAEECGLSLDKLVKEFNLNLSKRAGLL